MLLLTIGSCVLISNKESISLITGAQTSTPTGVANVTVTATTYISLPLASIDFGPMDNNVNNDTLNDSPAPFQLQNDGTVNVNVTIQATDIFTTAPNPNSSYQFACGSGEISCPTGSIVNLTNMSSSGNPILIIADLPFTDTGDQVEVDIGVTIPNAEPAGLKSSTVTFTATQA
ncbi:MAG: hypothetical protein ABIF40_03830 [archaeon]